MKKTSAAQTKIAIQDQQGRTVRVFLPQESQSLIVLNLHTGRIELADSTIKYIEENIPFKEIGKIRDAKSQAPIQLAQGLTLRVTEEIVDVTESQRLAEEGDEKKLFYMLKMSALVHGIILALFLATWGIYEKWLNPEQEIQVVTISPTPELIKPRKEAPKMVIPSRKIVTPKSGAVLPNKQAKFKNKPQKVAGLNNKNSKSRAGVGRMGPPGVNLKNSEVLLTLSQYNKAQGKSGGLNLAADPNTAHAGWGRGSQPGYRSMPGVGMNLGPGPNGPAGGGGSGAGGGLGAVGYNTRGRASGNGGYGTMAVKGSADFSVDGLEGEAEIEGGGGLTSEQIDAVIKRHLGQVRACYESGLQVSPGLQGRVAVSFVIAGNGRVSQSKIAHSSLRHSGVEGCINQRLRSWKFPKPLGNVNVKVLSYPFVLERLNRG